MSVCVCVLYICGHGCTQFVKNLFLKDITHILFYFYLSCIHFRTEWFFLFLEAGFLLIERCVEATGLLENQREKCNKACRRCGAASAFACGARTRCVYPHGRWLHNIRLRTHKHRHTHMHWLQGRTTDLFKIFFLILCGVHNGACCNGHNTLCCTHHTHTHTSTRKMLLAGGCCTSEETTTTTTATGFICWFCVIYACERWNEL